MTECLFGGEAFVRVLLQHVPDEVLCCRNQKEREFSLNYSQGNLCLNNLCRSWCCNTSESVINRLAESSESNSGSSESIHWINGICSLNQFIRFAESIKSITESNLCNDSSVSVINWFTKMDSWMNWTDLNWKKEIEFNHNYSHAKNRSMPE